MKKSILTIVCLMFVYNLTAQILIHAPRTKNQNEMNQTIEGSKYINPKFSEATISSSVKKLMVRYDAFTEMFEFFDPNDSKKDTFLINKSEQNKIITLLNSNKIYSLENFMNKDWNVNSTYFVEMKATENLILYKREKVNFTPEKPAENSMKRGFPAKYTRAEDSYFIKKTGDEYLLQFPESKKELIKMFPNKKEKIETYFKNNKNSFKTEADYISIIDLLTS